MDDLRQIDISLVDRSSGEILYRYKRTLPLVPVSSSVYPMKDALNMVFDCAVRGIRQGKSVSIAVDFNDAVYNIVPQRIPF